MQQLRDEVAAAGLPVDLRLAAEVRFHEQIPVLLAQYPQLTLDGGGRYLLLELPHDSIPPALPDFLFRLKAAGTTPVIAHPERNLGVRANPSVVAQWQNLGAVLQLTAGSLAGRFGLEIRRLSEDLLRSGHIHLLATDAHSPDRRPPVLDDAIAAAGNLVGDQGVTELLVENPRRILAGEPASRLTAPTAVRPGGWLSRLSRWSRLVRQ
jgi:protein-tyrosine phosphatase